MILIDSLRTLEGFLSESMLTIGMVVLALVTFLAMIGFVALCDRI